MINGFTHDVAWLASLAHAHGARLYVDAVQAAGCVPIDVRATGIDFLASASYKWLMGDFGLGFVDDGDRGAALEDMRRRWPRARASTRTRSALGARTACTPSR